jgi:hypothetical protein
MVKLVKNLILFVEGADGVGKTTITKRLSLTLGLPVIKMLKAKTYFKKNKEILEEFSYMFNNVLLQIKTLSYIVDRGPLSSLIYSRIYHRKSKLSYIYSILKEIDPVVIFLTTSKNSVLFDRRSNDKVIPISDRLKVLEGYEDFFGSQQIVKYFRVDTADLTPEQIVDKIVEHLKNENYIEK